MSRARKVVYPSDLSDAQWQIVAPVLRASTGQPGQVPRRAILNAIFYVLRTGCQWRFLPQSYPKWQTVYSCFRRWSLSGVWDRVVESLRVQVRYEQGRKALPTAAVIDTQSVKTTEPGTPKGWRALWLRRRQKSQGPQTGRVVRYERQFARCHRGSGQHR